MTIQEALYLIKKQIQDNEQNKQALAILQEAADIYEDIMENDVTYTLPEIKESMKAMDNFFDKYTNEEYDFSNARQFKLGKRYGK